MREIKYRAWDKIAKPNRMKSWEQLLAQYQLTQVFTSKDFELMQFTGQNDKDGVEIYEGDILINKSTISQPDGKLTTKNIGGIQILNGMTYLIGKTWQHVDEKDLRISEYKCLMLSPKIFEVVGSIYENPELLEVQE